MEEDAFTVDGQGRERVEESRTRLFHAYFILHGIASRIRCTREAAVPFSKTRAERGRRVSSLVVELVSMYVKQNEVVFFSNSLGEIISLTVVSRKIPMFIRQIFKNFITFIPKLYADNFPFLQIFVIRGRSYETICIILYIVRYKKIIQEE